MKWAMNISSCYIMIFLLKLKKKKKIEQPCKVPEIANGRFHCEDGEIDICYIECYEGHILNPLGMFPKSLSCTTDRYLEDFMKGMKRQQPCISKYCLISEP